MDSHLPRLWKSKDFQEPRLEIGLNFGPELVVFVEPTIYNYLLLLVYLLNRFKREQEKKKLQAMEVGEVYHASNHVLCHFYPCTVLE
jgi:hypothetical protein